MRILTIRHKNRDACQKALKCATKSPKLAKFRHSLCIKGRRLEKSIPLLVVAVVTDISYVYRINAFGDIEWTERRSPTRQRIILLRVCSLPAHREKVRQVVMGILAYPPKSSH